MKGEQEQASVKEREEKEKKAVALQTSVATPDAQVSWDFSLGAFGERHKLCPPEQKRVLCLPGGYQAPGSLVHQRSPPDVLHPGP